MESSKYTLKKVTDLPQMDPMLQNMMLRNRSGLTISPSQVAATHEWGYEIDIIVQLNNPAGEVPSQLKVSSLLEGNPLVTGTVPLGELEAISRHKNVKTLEAPRRITKALSRSVRDMNADARTLEQSFPRKYNGEGVIIGVIDFDFDFAHPNFRHSADDSSRILRLWDQRFDGDPPDGFDYGIEYSKDHIDQVLAQNLDDPYQRLGYDVGPDGHGTFVADIAAGNGRAANAGPGVAPGADLIFVNLGTRLNVDHELSFGNSKRLIDAIRYIFDRAGDRPVVINLSLGTHGGPHDGSTPVEVDLDRLLTDKNRRAAVIAAGNWYADNIHCSGTVSANAPTTIQWEIGDCQCIDQRLCPQEVELEIWYGVENTFSVVVVTPDGQRLDEVRLDETYTLSVEVNGVEQEFVTILHNSPSNRRALTSRDNHIDIFIDDTVAELAKGTWSIELHPVKITDGSFHGWIEREDCGTSELPPAQGNLVNSICTLGSISNGRLPIVVGAYIQRSPNRTIAPFSSAGPTRDGKEKPELCAPGVGVVAADSLTQGLRPDEGTSFAAPHVAGLVALMLQADGNLRIDEIRQHLQNTAHKDNPGYDPRMGYGRVDGRAALASVLGRQPLPTTAVPAVTAAVDGQYRELATLLETVGRLANENNVNVRFTVEVEPDS